MSTTTEAPIDPRGVAYLAGSGTLPEFIARLMVLAESERTCAAAARLCEDEASAALHTTRRWTMLQVKEALQQYCWRPAQPVTRRRLAT